MEFQSPDPAGARKFEPRSVRSFVIITSGPQADLFGRGSGGADFTRRARGFHRTGIPYQRASA